MYKNNKWRMEELACVGIQKEIIRIIITEIRLQNMDIQIRQGVICVLFSEGSLLPRIVWYHSFWCCNCICKYTEPILN